MTPKPLDNTAIETEVRKNLAGDGITGIQIEVDNGVVVTLKGNLKTSSDRQKAYDDRVSSASSIALPSASDWGGARCEPALQLFEDPLRYIR
jgi:hypothetical protein